MVFFWKLVRRIIGFYILRKGQKISAKNILELIRERRKIKKNEKNFLTYFIEANSKIINHSNVYKKA